MSDTFTEKTSTSWFGRIGQSFMGVLIGLILIVGMVVLLFWNEGRAVTTQRSLEEGASSVISVAADAIDPAHEGRLVHVSGTLATDGTPKDPEFGIAAEGIRLVRTAEMYQWKESSKSETKTKLGGGQETVTTYSYDRVWDDDAINSSDFKKPDGHRNPSKEIQSARYQVPQARLGAFTLDEPVLDEIGGEQRLPVSRDQEQAVRAAFETSRPLAISEGRIFIGRDPAAPAIGDYRIGYQVAPLGVVSVIGRQAGAKFAPYQTAAGDRLLIVDRGEVPAGKMFDEAQSENTLITWIIRGVGLVLLVVGFALTMGPIAVLADVIPPLGGLVRMGTGIIAFVLAVIVGTVTVATAWFFYRPLLALAILGTGALVVAAAVYLGRMRHRAVPATA